MAVWKDALQELDDGELYLHVTPGRAQALAEALEIALNTGALDKRKKGVVTAMRELLSAAASGQILERDPSCWVYVVEDVDPDGQRLTKIGHALDVDRRFARSTDRPTPLRPLAAWRFASIAKAMEREAAARKQYKAYDGGGGREWVKVKAGKVVADLKTTLGDPDWRSGV